MKETLDFLRRTPEETAPGSDGGVVPGVGSEACLFREEKGCRHVIRWETPSAAVSARLRIYATFLLLAVNLALLFEGRWGTANITLLVATVAVLFGTLLIETRERRSLRRSLDSTREAVEKAAEAISADCATSLLMEELGRILGSHAGTEEILEGVASALQRRLDFDRGLILLADPEKTRLESAAFFGYHDRDRELVEAARFRLDGSESPGLFAASFLKRKHYRLDDLENEAALPPWSLALPKKIGARSLLCTPIVRDGDPIGVISVDNVTRKRPLYPSDVALLEGVAALIGISIRNNELVEARVAQFNSIIQVLAASIDARDSLTSGHSEKVTGYALGICRELGLPRDYREMIRVASLLHDYGKIAIPDAILKKDGRLTDEEYDVVKTHSAMTGEILSRISFEGIYCEVPRIAAAHHERIDGTGYPEGLKGEEIPLGAKIIAVADYFEAITAMRHYRGPMPVEIAFDLLRNGCGSHFDGRIVDAFIAYYSKTHMARTITPPAGRGAIRVACRKPVLFSVDGRTAPAVTEDVSLKGAFLSTDSPVGEGASVDLTLPSGADEAVAAKGRIAWVNDDRRKKPAFPAGFGVEFVDVGESTEELFERLTQPAKEEEPAAKSHPPH